MSVSYFMNIVKVDATGRIQTLEEYFADDDLIPEIGLAFWEWDATPSGFDWRWSIGFDPVAEADIEGERLDAAERKALEEREPGLDDTYEPRQVVRALEHIAQAIRGGTDEPVLLGWRMATGWKTPIPSYDAEAFAEYVASEMEGLLDICRRAESQSMRLLSGYVP